jgi:hypothetical protein
MPGAERTCLLLRIEAATAIAPKPRRGQDTPPLATMGGLRRQVLTAMKTARQPWDWPPPRERSPVAQMRVKLERVEIMVRRKFIWLARFGLILLGALAVTVWIIALLVILLMLILMAVASKRSRLDDDLLEAPSP